MIFAYIDPGAGGLLLQALIAGALAIPFLVRNHIARAIDRVRSRFASESGAADEE